MAVTGSSIINKALYFINKLKCIESDGLLFPGAIIYCRVPFCGIYCKYLLPQTRFSHCDMKSNIFCLYGGPQIVFLSFLFLVKTTPGGRRYI